MENWSKKRVSYARKIVKKGMEMPFYILKAQATDKGVNIAFEDEFGKIEHEGLLKITNKHNDYINWAR